MTRVWTWGGVVAMAATAFGQGGTIASRLKRSRTSSSGRLGQASPRAGYPTSQSIQRTPTCGTGGRAGNLWKTENRGNTWTRSSRPTARIRSAPWSSTRRTRTSSGWGRERTTTSVASASATASTIDGRRRDLDADGTQELRAHPEHPHRSPRFERRLRERHRSAVERGRRPRPLQDDRRWQDLEGRPHHQPRHRRDRRRHGSGNPNVLYAAAYQRRRAVDSLLAEVPRARSTRRPRRREVDQADQGSSDGRHRENRPRHQLEESQDGLRARNRAARAGRLLPVG